MAKRMAIVAKATAHPVVHEERPERRAGQAHQASAPAIYARSTAGGPFSTGREAACSATNSKQVSQLRQSLRKSELPVATLPNAGREQRDLAGSDGS